MWFNKKKSNISLVNFPFSVLALVVFSFIWNLFLPKYEQYVINNVTNWFGSLLKIIFL